MIDKLTVPVFCGRDCSTPEVFLHMQNMILEVFEVIVRSFGSLEIGCMLAKNQIRPLGRFIALQMLQRIQREFMMRAAGMAGKDDIQKQGHPCLLGALSIQPGSQQSAPSAARFVVRAD